MAFPYDDDFEEETNPDFSISERPTVTDRRRMERKRMAQDPDYRIGRLIAEAVKLRKEHDNNTDNLIEHRQQIDRLNATVFGRQSIRPKVATAGIAAAVGGAVAGVIEMLRMIGILK